MIKIIQFEPEDDTKSYKMIQFEPGDTKLQFKIRMEETLLAANFQLDVELWFTEVSLFLWFSNDDDNDDDDNDDNDDNDGDDNDKDDDNDNADNVTGRAWNVAAIKRRNTLFD